MLNYIIFGDIHGRLEWKKIVEQYLNTGYIIIFLGDYVSTHEDISGEAQIENLKDILTYKEKYPDQIILLRGNHDLQHLKYPWASCSGYDRYVGEAMSKPELKDRYLEDTQWLVHDKDQHICFSHAGISKVWLSNMGCTIDEINNIEPNADFGFTSSNPWDCYGDSPTQPLTWIRPYTLITCQYGAPDLIQVVGHTTQKKIYDTFTHDNLQKLITSHPEISWGHLWLCDCLMAQYLKIEDGEFKTIDIKHD